MAVLLVAALASAQVASERKLIRQVDIEGLRRTPKSEILSRLSPELAIGQIYDPQAVIHESGRLYSLGNFRRVHDPIVTDYEDGVKITFVVEEKPVVRRIRFSGLSRLSQKQIVSTVPPLLTREGDLFNRYWLEQDRSSIEQKYLDAGYLFARVSAEATEAESGVTVVFQIQEGTQVRIRNIGFVGNRAISAGELLSQMSTREKDTWFFGLIRPGFYRPELLERDLRVLKDYYRRFGFFDVRIEPEEVRFDESKERLHISLRVDEGPVYLFQGYRFRGNAVFSEQTLRKLTAAPVGKPFNMDQMEKDRQQILKYYGDRAYIFADVKFHFEWSYEKTEMRVRFDIEEQNEVYIDKVKVEGNLKTQDRVIRRELEFYPGEKVDRAKLEKSRSNLARLQLFRDITYDYDESDSGDPSARDVIVQVEEEASGQLLLGFGVTSGFGVIGNLQITKRNFDITDLPQTIYDIPDSFTGAGQTLHLQAQPGTRRSFYRLTFIEPYLFDTRNSLSLSASKLLLVREDWDEDRATFLPRVGHSFDFDRDFRVTVGARLEEVEVEDIDDDAPADVFASRGTSAVIALGADVTYNKVLYEPYEGPYDGHRQGASYEYGGGALGGDVDFHKIEIENEFYFPLYVHRQLGLHHVISASSHIGVIEPHGGADFIPVFERYFLGGPRTVRGFRFRGLGPHEDGTPYGGTAQWWGNIEYKFPIFQKVLRGVVFFDYGNLSEELSTFSLSEMRYAAGGGLEINFPWLGQPLPIGLYFGAPIEKQPGDRERFFLFTIGAPF